MATEFKLPSLGEDLEGGVIVSVLVSEGDTLEKDQSVVEIETDKATLEVPCPVGGTVSKVHVKEGDTIKVGDALISVGEDGAAGGEKGQEERKKKEETEQKASSKAQSKAEPGKPKKAEEPDAKEQRAERGEEVDGADDTEEGAREAERPREKVQVSAGGLEDEQSRERKPQEAGQREEDSETRGGVSGDGKSGAAAKAKQPPAAPSTRRLARELGVDLQALAEKFPGENLSPDHVKAFVRDRMGQKGSAAPAGDSTGGGRLPLPDFEKWGKIDRVPLSALQRRTAERLTASWVAPHVTHYDAADVGALEAIRRKYAELADDHEPKLTITAFLVKAAVRALRKFPKFNATLDVDRNELILKHYYHIGVAVNTERGLFVPVVRDCDKKSMIQIAAELEDIAERTRYGKITRDEMRGATFTITNVGGIGGTAFAPILSWPEVAILGAARMKKEAVPGEGVIETRQMLPLCLSFDHRPINGVDAAYFVREVVEYLENPVVALMRQ
jgi:pyruvate dehydrogenase E2 component (dihydrolipoamide acetyltransferase)